jgi:hypothetical protein
MADLLEVHELFALACRHEKKWGLYLSFDTPRPPFTDDLDAAPCLRDLDHGQVLIDRVGVLLFDSREEMERAYDATDPARVYALTCSPEGQLLNENT